MPIICRDVTSQKYQDQVGFPGINDKPVPGQDQALPSQIDKITSIFIQIVLLHYFSQLIDHSPVFIVV